jgi:hypothetical protein
MELWGNFKFTKTKQITGDDAQATYTNSSDNRMDIHTYIYKIVFHIIHKCAYQH